MLVLGIETSCDETSVALVKDGTRILANLVSSQVEIHRPFGGVVPEMAGRAHLETLPPLFARALNESGIEAGKIDGVAFTRGPGLIGALLVGTAFAKGLAYARELPLVGVNHLQAHLYAPLLTGGEFFYPLIGMIVSGGHTLLVHARSEREAEIIGSTRDDAAGEAFDKAASLLGLDYPGGPEIEKAARDGDPRRYDLPRGMIHSGDYDFSFSGVKTALRYLIERIRSEEAPLPVSDLAASFQAAVVDVLVKKLAAAAGETRPETIVVGGGVVRNRLLVSRLREALSSSQSHLLIAAPKLCSDNAAMVAGLAFRRLRRGDSDPIWVDADPGLPWGRGIFY